jgi:putative heme-binding domain-containing protein
MWRIVPALLGLSLAALLPPIAAADDEPRPDSPLVKLLKSGRVPEERQGTIVEMIGKRGNAADLSYLYQQALRPDGFPEATRLKALDALAEAALTRRARPEGDPSKLATLIRPQGAKVAPALRLAATRLAGLWKAESLGDALREVAQSPDADPTLRAAALDALASIGGAAGRAGIEALAAPDRPRDVRALAVAALANLDVDAAAERAASVIRDAAPGEDLAPLLAAFLNRQGGADKLAAAIARGKVPADAAKLALRAVYALGHSDATLVAELTRAAGLNAEVKPLDKPELDRLVADVAARGNPERGEDVFRRADLSCTRCHAIAGAGGGVGPDLAAVGASSPVDYLINSVLLPDQAIKEEFHTLVVLTTEGQVYQGIVADRDDKRLVLKEATGERRTIPADQIEEQKEGGSLMPKGLVNLMTRDEFVDLIRFLSELGKPGPYAIRPTPTIQRWRVLKSVPAELSRSIPDPDTFRARVLGADEARWLPAYAKVSGDLPLDDLVVAAGGKVLYLQGEIDVTSAGEVAFRVDPADGVAAWVDDRPMPAPGASSATLTAGRHKLTLRIDTASRRARQVKVEVLKGTGSPAEFTVVGGR